MYIQSLRSIIMIERVILVSLMDWMYNLINTLLDVWISLWLVITQSNWISLWLVIVNIWISLRLVITQSNWIKWDHSISLFNLLMRVCIILMIRIDSLNWIYNILILLDAALCSIITRTVGMGLKWGLIQLIIRNRCIIQY